MIGSSIPGMAAEVLRADMADRTRAAEAGWARSEMKREIRAANAAARAARRSTQIGAQRRRWFRWIHRPMFTMPHRGAGTGST